MAVPKKKMSKTKSKFRIFNWNKKILKRVLIAISIAKSLSKGRRRKFRIK